MCIFKSYYTQAEVVGWSRTLGLECGQTLLCQKGRYDGCFCLINGLLLCGCSNLSVPWGGPPWCLSLPLYPGPTLPSCSWRLQERLLLLQKTRGWDTNARVMHTACKNPCQTSQAEGTMLYFYFKIIFLCMCARKRQKHAVMFNPAHLSVVKGGYNPHSTTTRHTIYT